MWTRRGFLKAGAAGGVLAASGVWLPASARPGAIGAAQFQLPPGEVAHVITEALPGKRPLIKRTFRPPNYETPVHYLNEMFTPNDVFFVRYHLASIPRVDAGEWRLRVSGSKMPLELNLDQLKSDFEQVELVAVCMCSGNRRGWFDPHVTGVEWGPGAMGNARWRGVRLKDVLSKAGVAKDAIEVRLDGADRGVVDKTPDFIKSIPVWKAMDDSTLIAFEMNGQPLPHWNGFPARVVVPGWTATYWVKQLTSVSVLTSPEQNFWMKTAYRIPKGKFPVVDRFMSQETDENTPITEMVVNSLITNVEHGQKFDRGRAIEIKGIAWDGGYGIHRLEISLDDGRSWREASLGADHGRFSWRQWVYPFRPDKAGVYTIMAKAGNRIGQSQTPELIHNPAGYHHNVIQKVSIQVV